MSSSSDRPTQPLPPELARRRRSWPKKFRDALRGVPLGVRGQNSFYAHFAVAAAVLVSAAVMGVSAIQWCVLLLCVTVVLAAEMFNTALEHISRAVTDEHNERIRDALDIGSAAVLVAAAGSVAVGAVVFLPRLAPLLGWW